MTAPLVLTKFVELRKQAQELLYGLPGYASREDPQVISMWDESEKLQAVNVVEASLVKADLCHICGDLAGVEYWLANASKTGASPLAVNRERLNFLINLGHFSSAADLYLEICDFRNGKLTWIWDSGVHTCCFAKMIEQMHEASKFAVELSPAFKALAIRASAALSRLGVNEAQVHQLLDAAGVVLRERGLFWQDRYPTLLIDDSDDEPGLLYQLVVEASAEDAELLTDQVIDLILDRGLQVPGVSVAFVGRPNGSAC